MGSAVSIPDKIDIDACRNLAGDKFSEEAFHEFCDEHGYITKTKLLELNEKTDCFITHNWGLDEEGRDNHERATRIKDSLVARNLIIWFDSERMAGNIADAMTAGISHASCVLLCITKKYAEKVAGKNLTDNCKLEFNYSVQRKIDSMIPIVMEKCMQRTADWPDGPLAMYFGTFLYYNLASDDEWERKMDELAELIKKKIRPIKRAARLKISRQTIAFKDESYKWIRVTPPTAGSESTAATASNHITVLPEACELLSKALSTYSPLHLVAIFGQARKGKSFLMNCLAGSEKLFSVRPTNTPCTNGVDISGYFVSLNDFQQGVSSNTTGVALEDSSDPYVGFVDAEGQGDHGVSYDVSLVCPLLLVSNIVIFNWSGRPAKNDILDKLMLLTNAAKMVKQPDADTQSSKSTPPKIFGHLHIVFRDLFDTDGIFDLVLAEETDGSDEAESRNTIRRLLRESFLSITISSLPPPVDSNRQLLSGAFTPSNVCEDFKLELGKLRAIIHSQLEGMLQSKGVFNGGASVYTGVMVSEIVKASSKVINQGKSELAPRSIVEDSQKQLLKVETDTLLQRLDAFLHAQSLPSEPAELTSHMEAELLNCVSTLQSHYKSCPYNLLSVAKTELEAAAHAKISALAAENFAKISDAVNKVTAACHALISADFEGFWISWVQKQENLSVEEVRPKVSHAAAEMLTKVQQLHDKMLESTAKHMSKWHQVQSILSDLKKELEAGEAKILAEAFKKQGVVAVVSNAATASKPTPRVVTVSGFSFFLSGWNGEYFLQTKKYNNAPVWKCPSHVNKGFPPVPIIGVTMRWTGSDWGIFRDNDDRCMCRSQHENPESPIGSWDDGVRVS